MCIGPSGFTTASCATGIDHNFGPKNHLIGGTGPNEKNVIGPTTLQGIEFSHGWNPGQPRPTPADLRRSAATRSIGNWVGFRGDGSYNASFRSGQNFSSSDNGNGINVYDGSNDNIDRRQLRRRPSTTASRSCRPTPHGNTVRDNIIGVSPTGDAAPLTGWGIVIRWSTRTTSCAPTPSATRAKGGIGLLNTMNSGTATSRRLQHPYHPQHRHRHHRPGHRPSSGMPTTTPTCPPRPSRRPPPTASPAPRSRQHGRALPSHAGRRPVRPAERIHRLRQRSPRAAPGPSPRTSTSATS